MIGYLVVLSPVNLDVVDLMTVQGSSVELETDGISLDVTAPLPKHMQQSWRTLGLEEHE